MLSLTTESKLAELIGATAENERLIEVKRQLLAEEPRFTPRSAFILLDRLRNDYLTGYEIKDFMRENGFVVTTEEASNLVEFFGSKSSLRMYYEDFVAMVMPADPVLRSVVFKRDDYPELLSKGAEFALAKLIQAEIDGNNRLIPYWSALTSRYDYNVFDAFRTIDKYRTGYIMPSDLSSFLKRAGYVGRFDDADVFIRRLDIDKDGRLSYEEFVDGLVPKFAQREEKYAKYSYTEKKPSYYRRHLESPAPRTEYKPSRYRLGSEERYPYTATIRKYESPLKSTYISPAKETYVSPYKEASTYAATPYKSLYATYLEKEAPVTKKLEYAGTLSPSKQRQLATELALAMEEQITYERRFENAKEDLSLQPDFNLMDGFRVFDYTGKGFVTMTEFYDGLKDLGVTAGYSDITQLFKRLDKDSDGRVRYSDYCALFTPKRAEYEKMLASRPPYHMHHLIEREVYFTTKTRASYREALEIALEHERALEGIRQRLKRSPYFNPYDAFNVLDIQGKGHVSMTSVIFCEANKRIAKGLLGRKQGVCQRGRIVRITGEIRSQSGWKNYLV